MPRHTPFLIGLLLSLMAASAHAADRSTLPTFGVSFTTPTDALLYDQMTHDMAAAYIFPPTNSPNGGGEIIISVNPAPKGKTLADVAAGVAQSGKTVRSDTTIGGEKAIKLTGTKPRRDTTYITIHDDRVYKFASRSFETDTRKPLVNLVASVKFIPVEPPTEHLAALGIPFGIFDLFTINGPNAMRAERGSEKIDLNLQDIINVENSLAVEVQMVKTPSKAKFADFKGTFTQTLQAAFHIPEPITWHDQKGVPNLHVTKPFKSVLIFLDGTEQKALNRFAILELCDGNVVEIVFSFSDGPVSGKYVDLSERMLATIKLGPKPPTTRQ